MAHVFADNVREGSVSEGTGDFVTIGGIPSPGGVIVGRELSSVLTSNDTFDYTIFHTMLNEWEIGVGTYLGNNSFSRNPTSSSNANNLVPFSSGPKQVFIAPVAERMIDPVSDNRLPHVQSGKTFTSTVTVTGESGIRVIYGSQEMAFGGTPADSEELSSNIRITEGGITWYLDEDKVAEGWRFRAHNSGGNFRDVLSVSYAGHAVLGNFTVTANECIINDRVIKSTSNAVINDQQTFPVGHTLLVLRDSSLNRNASRTVRLSESSNEEYVTTGSGGVLSGTWRSRGRYSGVHMMERVA